MATRARIGIAEPNGSVTSIYTHWDGYPEHHLPILTAHYTTETQVRVLLALGDLSILGETIGERHDFDSHNATHPDWCLFFGRDRGEKDVAGVNHPADHWPDTGSEYQYLFTNGRWQVDDD